MRFEQVDKSLVMLSTYISFCECDALETVDVGRRHRHALAHQVHERPQRLRDGRRHAQRRAALPAHQVPAECGGRRAVAVRLLSRQSRPQDAPLAHEDAHEQRAGRCRRALRQSARRPGHLSWLVVS